MNSTRLKDKINNISKEKDVPFNSVLRMYMYDRFIERLSASKYRDNFILKGGFYLSTLFGIENRATMDIDMSLTKVNFTKDDIEKILNEIINIDIKDEAILSITKIGLIREEDEYGGFRADILVKLQNVREKFQIDIATGDPIIPKAIILKYLPTVGTRYINLWAYNMETVIAEKLETILTRIEASSRMKDYYDLYLIYKMKLKNIDKENLRKAVKNTFKKRNFTNDAYEVVKRIENSEILKTRWEVYARKNAYANEIAYSEVTNCLKKIIDISIPVTV